MEAGNLSSNQGSIRKTLTGKFKTQQMPRDDEKKTINNEIKKVEGMIGGRTKI